MAETTNIAWCDSTFNPWIGCAKVSPGCDHCYAADQDSRKRWDGGKTHWGAGVPRYRTSAANWKQPIAWNKKAAAGGKPWRVFCASLADVFDNEVPQQWREDLWRLINATPHLSWLLLTKRIGNVARMLPQFDSGFMYVPENVRIMITVCNQEEAVRDIPKLPTLPCKNGISYEPALGAVDWMPWLMTPAHKAMVRGYPGGWRGIDWIICGGESGPGARSMDIEWARSTIAQCKAAGVPVFMKQLGAYPIDNSRESAMTIGSDRVHMTKDVAGRDMAEWPADLRCREFPA